MSTTSKFAKLLGDDSGATLDTSSIPLVFLTYGIQKTVTRVEEEGLRGTRSRKIDRVTEGLLPLAGQITAEPSPTEWDFWLQWLTGGTKSSTNIPLAETITGRKFGVYYGSTVDRWMEHDGCVCASGQISSSTGEKVRFTADAIGTTETLIDPNSTAFPSVAFDTQTVYMHHNLTMTLGGSVSSGVHSGGTAFTAENVTIGINNGVTPAYRNSQVASDLTARDRIVTVSIQAPFTSTERALYTSTPFAAKFAWVIGGLALTIVFPSLKAEITTPNIPGGTGEVMLPLNCRAYITGSETQEIFITNDITA